MSNTQIHQLKLRVSNAYLIKSSTGSILVDTGSPGEAEKIIESLQTHGVSQNDLRLIVHTHIHADHAGSTAALKAHFDVPTAYHPHDQALMEQGNNGHLNGIGLRGKLFAKLFSGADFDTFTSDVSLSEGMSFSEFGVNARILHTPGHTPGSISVVVNEREAIIGDVWMGGFMGGNVMPHKPNYHYFVDDMTQLKQSMTKLLDSSLDKVYVGHGGPLDATNLQRWAGRKLRQVVAIS